ncbi:MAG TPA: phosphoglycerate dehydrogenase [Mycobacteriales bacterium]|nr:phosphoglycerate dehydrogenase [Mycobacteriales bacterium]
MSKPVVLIAEELAPAALEVLAQDCEVRHVDGADRGALLPALADVDAVIVRSATQIDAEALAAGNRLKVVARAGVGLDNVDAEAATARGVLVVNAPTSNITSAAEHAVALLLSAARNIPAANESLKAGQWKRSAFTGVEVTDKTVGVVGLGKIGVLFAKRMESFGVRLVAYDPYVSAARAAEVGVELLALDEVLAQSDFVSIHLPKTKETAGLIGERELGLMKPDAILVNAARGGLVDEHALAQALKEGRIRGAAVDVFATEPCTDSPLFAEPRAVVTPHLGASTAEAQDKAGLAVARSVKLALAGELVPDAVNVQGGAVAEELRPSLPLIERLGRLFTALAAGVPTSLTVDIQGELADFDVDVLQLAALRGVFTDVVEDQVTYVNAPLLAAERGIKVTLTKSLECPDYRNVLTVRGILPDGTAVSVGGNLQGPRLVQKLVEVNGYDIEVALAEHMVFVTYDDRPGIVGAVGQLLGQAGVNIAGMQVSRTSEGGSALMVLTIDSAIPPAVLDEIASAVGASHVRAAYLPVD